MGAKTSETVAITGGAGSLGRQVAAQLHQAGHRLRILDLPHCDFGAYDGLEDVDVIRGSIEDRDLLRRAVVGVDVVIHLAAILPPHSERDRSQTMSVNVGGTENLIGALQQESPDARLVFSSSVCVYGDTSSLGPPITIDTPPNPLDIYGESKVRAEGAVLDGGLPHTILRISGISVPEFLAPPQVWPFMADQRIEFICREDVVTALVRCADMPLGDSQVLNISGGQSWRMRGAAYVAAYNDIMGLAADDAAYLERPGSFGWYDTDESQRVLGYQETPFDRFQTLLEGAIEEALGDD